MAFAYAKTNALGTSSLVSRCTATGGPNDTTLNRLNDGRLDAQYVSSSTTSLVLVFNLGGSGPTVVGIAILNHNLATLTSPTITLESSPDNVTYTTRKSATTPNSSAPQEKDTVLQMSSPPTRQYWRITIAWTGSAVCKIGEIFFYETATQLTRGQNDGSGEVEHILGTSMQMLYGETRFAFLGGPLREKMIRSSDFSTANNNELLALWRSVKGPTTPFLWIESYEASSSAAAVAEQDCIFGRLMLPDFAWTWSDFNLKQPPQLVIRSLGREVGA